MQLGLLGGRLELRERCGTLAYKEWMHFLKEHPTTYTPDSIERLLAVITMLISKAGFKDNKSKPEDFWPPMGEYLRTKKTDAATPDAMTDAEHTAVAKNMREAMSRLSKRAQ